MYNRKKSDLCPALTYYTYKRLRLTITSTSLTINILIPVYLHENITFPHSSDQVSPSVRLSLKRCFQELLMSCMFTRCLVTPSSSEDDHAVAGLLLLLALHGWLKLIRKRITAMSYSIISHSYWFCLWLIHWANNYSMQYHSAL